MWIWKDLSDRIYVGPMLLLLEDFRGYIAHECFRIPFWEVLQHVMLKHMGDIRKLLWVRPPLL